MSRWITGDKQLRKNLQALAGKEGKKAVMKGLRQAAKEELSQQQSAVPVDTGNWKGSLKIRALPRSRVAYGVRVTSKTTGGEDAAFYGAMVELGHHTRGKDADGQGKWVEGQHKMLETAKDGGLGVLETALDLIQNEILKVMTAK